MSLKSAKLLAALMMGAAMANNDERHYPMSKESELAIKCGMCKNFPKGKFCKLAKHHVCKETPANKCGFYLKQSGQ